MNGASEQSIREAERQLFAAEGVAVEESFLDLTTVGLRVRVLSHGSGPPLVLLHGVSLNAAVWVPLFTALRGHRLLAVDLPGHGLSDPVNYRRGHVRDHAHQLLEDVFDALGLERVNVVGHSLGGMFALWHAARDGARIARLVAVGDPAVALPGTRVRMPLSLLTVRGLGRAVLRSPAPRFVYRRMLAQGMGGGDLDAAPEPLVASVSAPSSALLVPLRLIAPFAVMLDGLDAERGCDVRFAGAGTADEDDVVCVVEELASVELANERLVDLAAGEVEAIEISVGREASSLKLVCGRSNFPFGRLGL